MLIVLVVEDLEVTTGVMLVLVFLVVVEDEELAASVLLVLEVLLEMDEVEEDFVDDAAAGVTLVLEP